VKSVENKITYTTQFERITPRQRRQNLTDRRCVGSKIIIPQEPLSQLINLY